MQDRRVPVLETLRRSASLAALLALALVAGPAVAAACPADEPETPAHEMPAMAGMHHDGEAPTCHEAPAPAPERDCAQACCAASVPLSSDLPALVASADVPAIVVSVRVEPEAAPAPPPVVPEPSPPERRLHAEFERFLI